MYVYILSFLVRGYFNMKMPIIISSEMSLSVISLKNISPSFCYSLLLGLPLVNVWNFLPSPVISFLHITCHFVFLLIFLDSIFLVFVLKFLFVPLCNLWYPGVIDRWVLRRLLPLVTLLSSPSFPLLGCASPSQN